MNPLKTALAAALSFGVVAATMVPANSASFRTSPVVKGDTSLLVPVHKRRNHRHRHRRNGDIVGALIGGLIIGGAISRNRRYYDGDYYGGRRYYRHNRSYRNRGYGNRGYGNRRLYRLRNLPNNGHSR